MPKPVRCAIYTRKSTEEGLEQGFNSLDAQREACEAYIKSQMHEGWQLIPKHYDDGGFSGGNMERPALKMLLKDISGGLVDVVVVYKVDRLTRALTDFSKIVDVFDQAGVSFVSITQQFNTTTSMGRLTLNMLLSFAQFEREVTAERIRDKIAASKRKGMWTGGPAPLGYDIVDKKLIVNPTEAKQIEYIYQQYLTHRNVVQLREELKERHIYTKRRKTRAGKETGDKPISLGNLYNILNNPLYMGKIAHKDELYDGQHEAIVKADTWHKVQESLRSNRIGYAHRLKAQDPSLLKGRIFNTDGIPYTPKHGCKGKRRFRYYVLNTKIKREAMHTAALGNLPAHDIEDATFNAIKAFLRDKEKLIWLASHESEQRTLTTHAATRLQELESAEPDTICRLVRSLVCKVTVHDDSLDVDLSIPHTRQYLLAGDIQLNDSLGMHADTVTINMPVKLTRYRKALRLVVENDTATDINQPNPAICKALARAYVWNKWLKSGEVKSIRELCRIEGLNERYVMDILPLAWLEPKIIEELINGRFSTTLENLIQETAFSGITHDTTNYPKDAGRNSKRN